MDAKNSKRYQKPVPEDILEKLEYRALPVKGYEGLQKVVLAPNREYVRDLRRAGLDGGALVAAPYKVPEPQEGEEPREPHHQIRRLNKKQIVVICEVPTRLVNP